jgi:hypothetical protein
MLYSLRPGGYGMRKPHKTSRAFEFIIVEHVFLLLGALAFAAIAILLIDMKAENEYITTCFSSASALLGALLRGLITTGHTNGRPTNENNQEK